LSSLVSLLQVLFFVAGNKAAPTTNPTGTTGNITARAYDPAVDHMLGNPQATVKVVEYYDLECPHCKLFQETLHKVIEHYGAQGNVAWVSRPFPIASIHSKAPQEAQAAECAAEQGGDVSYFKYIDKLFEQTPSNNGLDLAQLPVIAEAVGLDKTKLASCVASNKYAKKISDSYSEALKYGAQGTPFTLLMVGTDAVVINGNQPYDSMVAAIDAVLAGAQTKTQ
jgi:protein-disulfide isomerase